MKEAELRAATQELKEIIQDALNLLDPEKTKRSGFSRHVKN